MKKILSCIINLLKEYRQTIKAISLYICIVVSNFLSYFLATQRSFFEFFVALIFWVGVTSLSLILVWKIRYETNEQLND